MPIPRLTLDNAALLVVDVQEKLLPVIDDHDAVVRRAGVLLDGCVALGVPVLATEQYPRGLGRTVAPIASRLPAETRVAEKLKFSACVAPVRERLAELGRSVVILCGIEAHVCVTQTALDLAELGYVVAVATDATGSRRASDKAAGLARMTQAGVVPVSVEMALLELVHEAGTERFKTILPLIK